MYLALSICFIYGVFSIQEKIFIKNMKIPICINCRHFLQYDVKGSNIEENKYGKCKLFGTKDVITGHIEYYFASTCRSEYAGACGIEGKYFEEIPEEEIPESLP